MEFREGHSFDESSVILETWRHNNKASKNKVNLMGGKCHSLINENFVHLCIQARSKIVKPHLAPYYVSTSGKGGGNVMGEIRQDRCLHSRKKEAVPVCLEPGFAGFHLQGLK